MKKIDSPSAVFKWKGELAEVVGIAYGKQILFTQTENCPHCNLPIKAEHSVVQDSPYFEANAEAVNTLEELA